MHWSRLNLSAIELAVLWPYHQATRVLFSTLAREIIHKYFSFNRPVVSARGDNCGFLRFTFYQLRFVCEEHQPKTSLSDTFVFSVNEISRWDEVKIVLWLERKKLSKEVIWSKQFLVDLKWLQKCKSNVYYTEYYRNLRFSKVESVLLILVWNFIKKEIGRLICEHTQENS